MFMASKINVRHITDGRGVVFGSLLVTPKTAMFNPNATDLLVMETGQPDGYQVVAPAELVVNYAIFNDFYKFNSSTGIAVKEEDKGTLFLPNEDGEKKSELPHRQGSLEPMYLRMVMGKPRNKRLPRHAPIMSYGSQTLEPEYWFIVPPEKADALASVLAHLFPEKYGLLDHMAIERSGYEVIRDGIRGSRDNGQVLIASSSPRTFCLYCESVTSQTRNFHLCWTFKDSRLTTSLK